jgi:hypothetical protein
MLKRGQTATEIVEEIISEATSAFDCWFNVNNLFGILCQLKLFLIEQ